MKKLFRKGLVALLPMVVTIFVVYYVATFLYDYVGTPLGNALRYFILSYGPHGEKAYLDGAQAETFLGWVYRYSPWFGLVAGLILTFVIGTLVATLFGKQLWRATERILQRLPVVGVIYPYAKQFTEFLSTREDRPDFKNAVAVPFPTQGVYSVGFVTGEGLRYLNDHLKKPMVTVFVPTSPTPFTGYVCWYAREDVLPLPITVDEAMRLLISCGVLMPGHQSAQLTDFAARAADIGRPLASPLPERTSPPASPAE